METARHRSCPQGVLDPRPTVGIRTPVQTARIPGKTRRRQTNGWGNQIREQKMVGCTQVWTEIMGEEGLKCRVRRRLITVCVVSHSFLQQIFIKCLACAEHCPSQVLVRAANKISTVMVRSKEAKFDVCTFENILLYLWSVCIRLCLHVSLSMPCDDYGCVHNDLAAGS